MIILASDEDDALVDDVIEFLEQFRGKRFWNAATGDVAFRLDGEFVCCDSLEAHINRAYEEEGRIGELVEMFFESGETEETEERWRDRLGMNSVKK